jgi:hypothetical protein
MGQRLRFRMYTCHRFIVALLEFSTGRDELIIIIIIIIIVCS